MSDQGQMFEIAVAAIRWNQARLGRIEAEKIYRESKKNCPLKIGGVHLYEAMQDARRIESRRKHLLARSCGQARPKADRFEVIDI